MHSMMDLHTTTSSSQTIAAAPTPYEPKHVHGLPILQRHGLTANERLYWENYNTTTFFTTDLGNRFALRLHVSLILCSFVVIFPLYLILNHINARNAFFFLSLHFSLMLASLLSLVIFTKTFPQKDNNDWYPNNIYLKSSTILFIFLTIHYLMNIYLKYSHILSFCSSFKQYSHIRQQQNSCSIPLDDLSNHESSPTSEDTVIQVNDIEDNGTSNNPKENISLPKGFSLLDDLVQFSNIPILFFIGTNVLIGLAVGNLLGKGQRVFNLLAHWIKGGVFFALGILCLARYCGLGESYGWAWNNIVYEREEMVSQTDEVKQRKGYYHSISKYMPRGTITMEGLESFLICFYGCTNIFLEHLAGAGGEWTAKDLQHVSIAFMYIGTGLCGILIEMKLNEWRFQQVKLNIDSKLHENKNEDDDNMILAGSPGYSLNPFPTFTIFWTGILMSQHAQASELSTKVHIQWGLLLSYGSFFRLFTFMLLYFKPSRDLKPTRPITELITSFCLICGGMIFMESTDQVIEAMEYRGFTPLFSCNLSVGVTVLLMSWILILFMIRDWLLNCQREESRV